MMAPSRQQTLQSATTPKSLRRLRRNDLHRTPCLQPTPSVSLAVSHSSGREFSTPEVSQIDPVSIWELNKYTEHHARTPAASPVP